MCGTNVLLIKLHNLFGGILQLMLTKVGLHKLLRTKFKIKTDGLNFEEGLSTHLYIVESLMCFLYKSCD